MRIFRSKEGAQITRFSLVGALSVLVYYGMLCTLTELLHVWYITSAFVAFLGYYIVNFSLQKCWAFQNKSKQYIKRQLTQFTAMAVGNWILNTTLLYLLVEYAHWHYLLAQGMLTIVVSIIAYFVLRWIFRSA